MTPILAVAFVQFMNGNALLDQCGRSALGPPSEVCQGYVMGVVDSESQRVGRGGEPLFCVPLSATSEQVADVARQYLERVPEKRTALAAGMVMYSLKVAFPCLATVK